jgi:acetyltransferase
LTCAWGVDVVRPTDRPALDKLFGWCSAETLYHRFFGLPATWPRAYLAAVLAGRPEVHDGVVVRYGDGLHLAGLASLAAGSVDEPAELGVLVGDPWQRRGFGAALVSVLLDRACRRGVERVSAEVLPARAALLTALARRLERQQLTRTADNLVGVFQLSSRSDSGREPGPHDRRR